MSAPRGWREADSRREGACQVRLIREAAFVRYFGNRLYSLREKMPCLAQTIGREPTLRRQTGRLLERSGEIAAR